MSCTWLDCTDKGGETIKVECYDGLYFPPKPIPVTSEEQCHAIRDMEVRDDDIFILSYPKSVPYNSWFDYELEWQKELKAHPEMEVLHLYYEDMKKDPVSSVKTISSYLNRDLSDETIKSIADACTFKKMKNAYDEIKGDKLRGEWKDGSGSGIFRKGEVGDWKNWFTVAQSERFDQEYKSKMANSEWTYKFEI